MGGMGNDRIRSKLPDVREVPLASLGAVSVAAAVGRVVPQQGPPPVRVAAFQSAI
jgi:FXSXX-COOH protein